MTPQDDVQRQLQKQFPRAKISVEPDKFGTRSVTVTVDAAHYEEVLDYTSNRTGLHVVQEQDA